MSSTLTLTTFWLAFTFGIHIMMVNLSVGLAPLILYYRNRSIKDKRYEVIAKGLARFYAATYGLAGVFATAFTVFLVSFYPEFIGLAGNIALLPFGIAILMIALNFLSIALYWYGWDKWSLRTHNLIGLLLVISAFLIPFGFRAVFAFLNIPTGLHFDTTNGKFYLSVTEFLRHNPTFWPLYLKTITAALTATFIVVSAGYAYKYHKAENEDHREVYRSVVNSLIPPALVGLILMFFFGLWYALSLMKVPYKFNNIFGGFGLKVGDIGIAYNFSWAFILKMFFYVSQLVIVILIYRSTKKGKSLSISQVKQLIYAGFAALATIVTGEYLNAFSQYPWFIAAITDKATVVKLLSEVPSSQREVVARNLVNVLNLKNHNILSTLPGVTWLTAGFLAILIIAAIYYVYLLLLKPSSQAQGY